MRSILTPGPSYTEDERDRFYRTLVALGTMLTEQGVPVIFDATAHRRAYRDLARTTIPHFLEIYVDCSLRTCMERDPKGIYQSGQTGKSSAVPGLQTPYEPPENPDLVIVSDREEATDPKFPQRAARRISDVLRSRDFLPATASAGDSDGTQC
jgi:adenylylsulfate kinase